jgi:hypothetical protein
MKRPSIRSSANSSIKPWVKTALSQERLFGNGWPHWTNLPSAEEAEEARRKRVRFLKKDRIGADPLRSEIANVLDTCEPRERCLSGACPECGRAFAKFMVAEADALFKRRPSRRPTVLVCSVIPNAFVSLGDILHADNDKSQSTLKRALSGYGATVALGGVDCSFNEHQYHEFDPRWSLHFWFLLEEVDGNDLRLALKNKYSSNEFVRRPVKIVPWDGGLEALGYAFKSEFHRRQTYKSVRHGRTSQNTRHLPLRAIERLYLFSFLHQIGLASRAFLFGIRPTNTLDGVSLARLTRKANQSFAGNPKSVARIGHSSPSKRDFTRKTD